MEKYAVLIVIPERKVELRDLNVREIKNAIKEPLRHKKLN